MKAYDLRTDGPAARPGANPTNRVRLGVAVIVLDEREHLLLVRRGSRGGWTLPSSPLQAGETVPVAAKHCVFGVAKMEIKVTMLLGIYSDLSAHRVVIDPDDPEPVHLIDVVLEARAVGKLSRAPRELENEPFAFFSQEHLPLETEIDPRFVAPILDYLRGHTGVVR